MTIKVAFWLASISAAAIFTAIGILICRLRVKDKSDVQIQHDPALLVEIENFRSERSMLNTRCEALENEASSLAKKNQELNVNLISAQKERDALITQLSTVQADEEEDTFITVKDDSLKLQQLTEKFKLTESKLKDATLQLRKREEKFAQERFALERKIEQEKAASKAVDEKLEKLKNSSDNEKGPASSSLTTELKEKTEKLERITKQFQQSRASTAKAIARANTLQSEIVRLNSALEEARQKEERVDILRSELHQVRSKHKEAKSEVERLSVIEKEHALLSDRVKNLQEALNALKGNPTIDENDVEDDDTIRLDSASTQPDKPLTPIQTAEKQNKEMANRVSALEAQVTDVTDMLALGIPIEEMVSSVSQKIPYKAAHPNAPCLSLPEGGSSIGNSLQHAIKQLLDEECTQSAVLADEIGLVVASAGEHSDALAAVSAIYSRVGLKLCEILPLSTLHRVILVDDKERHFTTLPINTSVGQLMLATLSIGPLDTTKL